jgi:hypothetical protein
MSILFLILKLAAVLFFLVMFLRGNRLVWGIGLLTVTTALLLDTFLDTFSREEMAEEFGFFFYVLAGLILAGAALWLWGLLRPYVGGDLGRDPAGAGLYVPRFRPAAETTDNSAARPAGSALNTAYDRPMLRQQIHQRFGPEDVLDLIFDLNMNENDLLAYGRPVHEVIDDLMDLAEARGQEAELALAVERILTPIPRENLPRLEKLSADSPHSVLRYVLLARYSQPEIAEMAAGLDVNLENISEANKQAQVRNLLLYLYRRNRIDDLVAALQAPQAGPAAAE